MPTTSEISWLVVGVVLGICIVIGLYAIWLSTKAARDFKNKDIPLDAQLSTVMMGDWKDSEDHTILNQWQKEVGNLEPLQELFSDTPDGRVINHVVDISKFLIGTTCVYTNQGERTCVHIHLPRGLIINGFSEEDRMFVIKPERSLTIMKSGENTVGLFAEVDVTIVRTLMLSRENLKDIH